MLEIIKELDDRLLKVIVNLTIINIIIALISFISLYGCVEITYLKSEASVKNISQLDLYNKAIKNDTERIEEYNSFDK